MGKPLKIILITSIVLIISVLLALYFFYNPSVSNLFPKCLFYSTTNLHCPGCGTQRALHDILQGNLITGFGHNILLVLLIVVLAYQLCIRISNSYFNKNYQNLLHKAIITKGILVGVILFWILRNINIYPFTLLAP